MHHQRVARPFPSIRIRSFSLDPSAVLSRSSLSRACFPRAGPSDPPVTALLSRANAVLAFSLPSDSILVWLAQVSISSSRISYPRRNMLGVAAAAAVEVAAVMVVAVVVTTTTTTTTAAAAAIAAVLLLVVCARAVLP